MKETSVGSCWDTSQVSARTAYLRAVACGKEATVCSGVTELRLQSLSDTGWNPGLASHQLCDPRESCSLSEPQAFPL